MIFKSLKYEAMETMEYLSILSTLHTRIGRLESQLAAPIPKDKEYTEEEQSLFTSLSYQEKQFAEDFGEDIPENYMIVMNDLFDSAHHWVSEARNGTGSSKKLIHDKTFKSHMIEFSLGMLRHESCLFLTKIVIRPCAEGCGFYRLLLWKLRNIVIELDLERLEIASILSHNRQILKRLGFEIVPRDNGKNFDAVLSRNELKKITKIAWNIPESFPSSAQLNDENFVNRPRRSTH